MQQWPAYSLGCSSDPGDATRVCMLNVAQATRMCSLSPSMHTGSPSETSSMDSVTEGEPVCMLGLKLHILVAGATFNLHTRLASPGKLLQPKE